MHALAEVLKTGAKKKWVITTYVLIDYLTFILFSITVWLLHLKSCSLFNKATLDLSTYLTKLYISGKLSLLWQTKVEPL